MEKYLQFFRLLNKELKIRFFKLFFLTLFATFIESFSISLFLPIISLISDENNSKIGLYYSKLGIDISIYTYQSIVIFTMLGLLLTYLIKSIILSISSWKYSIFIFDIKKYISIQLFKKYLFAEYEQVIEKNSSESIRNIITETHLLVVDFIIPSIILFTELIIVTGIMLLLLCIEPEGVMLVSVTICSAIFIFHKTTKKLLKILGFERQYSEGKKIQVIQETIQGIKNVKIFGREKFFLGKFIEFTTLSSKTEAKQLTLAQLPRFWLEITAIIGLVILVIYSIGGHHDQASNKSLLTTIGLFAIAAFRILPSSNRILSSIQSIKYSSSVINLIIKELSTSIKSSNFKNVQPYIFKNNIQLKNVTFSYKKTNKLVLNNISFEIKKNQCLGIIGASGAGKSTLIDLILGLIRIKKGIVKIDGKTIDPNIDKWKNLVGYVPQNIFLLEDTIKNNILFGDSKINPIALEESIEFANLSAFFNTLPNGIETKIGEHGNNLSGGQLQRIGIARALYKKPEILILDEATSALDNKTEIEILSTIEKIKTNTTVIIITHRKSSLRICDSIIKIHKGQVLKIK